jgi:hypothetical protein
MINLAGVLNECIIGLGEISSTRTNTLNMTGYAFHDFIEENQKNSLLSKWPIAPAPTSVEINLLHKDG